MEDVDCSYHPILEVSPLWILGWPRNGQSLVNIFRYLGCVFEDVTQQDVNDDSVLFLACHLGEGGDAEGGVHRAVVFDSEQRDGQATLVDGHDRGGIGASAEESGLEATGERFAERFEDGFVDFDVDVLDRLSAYPGTCFLR